MFLHPLMVWLQNSCCSHPLGSLHYSHLSHSTRFCLATQCRIDAIFLLDKLYSRETICFLKKKFGSKMVLIKMTWEDMDFKSRKSVTVFYMRRSWIYKIHHRVDQQVPEKDMTLQDISSFGVWNMFSPRTWLTRTNKLLFSKLRFVGWDLRLNGMCRTIPS